MKVEVRSGEVKIAGYVNAVGRESRQMFSAKKGKPFIEIVDPGTFQKAINKADEVRLLFNHDKSRQLGSTKDNSLNLYEDSIGLYAEATIRDDEVVEKARNKELRGWSFGFVDQQESWVDGEPLIRHLNNIDLTEVSVLTNTPAYVAMSIETRSEDVATVLERRYLEEDVNSYDIEDKTEQEIEDEASWELENLKIQNELLKIKGANYNA